MREVRNEISIVQHLYASYYAYPIYVPLINYTLYQLFKLIFSKIYHFNVHNYPKLQIQKIYNFQSIYQTTLSLIIYRPCHSTPLNPLQPPIPTISHHTRKHQPRPSQKKDPFKISKYSPQCSIWKVSVEQPVKGSKLK